jgi:hypothetical protein
MNDCDFYRYAFGGMWLLITAVLLVVFIIDISSTKRGMPSFKNPPPCPPKSEDRLSEWRKRAYGRGPN